MRWIAMGVLFVGSTAWAGEPASCESLDHAEQVVLEAQSEVDRLLDVAFGEDFERRLAYVDADERDAMLVEQTEARKQLPKARKALRVERKSLKQTKKSVKVSGVVCSPPDVAFAD